MKLNRFFRNFCAMTIWGGCSLLVLPAVASAGPRFYLPFDGNSNVIGENGRSLAPAQIHGQPRYRKGVNGEALELRRYAYDQVTALHLNKLPPVDCREGTVSFWINPLWKGEDDSTNWLFYGTAGKFRCYLIKLPKGKFELSVCSPNQRQIIASRPVDAGTWSHLAFTWNIPQGEVALYVNGRIAAKQKKTEWTDAAFSLNAPLNIWLGKQGYDRFKTEVGEGAYDDLRIYDRALSPAEIFAEALGNREQKMQPRPLSDVRVQKGTMEFRFQCRNGRFPTPLPLISLGSGEGEILVTSMGVSGKLCVRAGEKVLESPYVPDLRSPLKMTLIPSGKKMRIYFDDALQGELELPAKWSSLRLLKAVDGVKFLTEDPAPDPILSSVEISPLEQKLWSPEGAERRSYGGIREALCLNGVWRMFKADHYSSAPREEGERLYSRVPGSPRSVMFQHYREKNGSLEVVEQSHGKQSAGWYQRTFSVPEEWRGKRIFLKFDNLNGNYGRVYLNGKLIDSFRQDFKAFYLIPNVRKVDVTELVREVNLLSVFVDRFPVAFWKDQLDIQDHFTLAVEDVWLEASPSPVVLRNALVLPSFRKSSVELRAGIWNPRKETGRAELEFRFRRPGEKEKVFSHRFRLNGEEKIRIAVQKKWRNPVLWDCENPNLYTLSVSLSINGKKADALPDADFGFREFWVENGEFRLNGKKIRLRMYSNPAFERVRAYFANPYSMPQYVSHIRELNYDTVRFSPIRKHSLYGDDLYLRESDRQGLYNLYPMPPYEEDEMQSYRKNVERYLEYYGTHPSILMWYTDFNTCHYAWNQDPAKLNDTEYVPKEKVKARKLARTAETVMRSLDPSREVFQHAGGNSGKIFTSMNYQSMGTPVQEQEDWPKQWAEKHTQPLMVVESGFPFFPQFSDFEGRGPGYTWLVAENAARYFGDRVFARESRPVPMNFRSVMGSPFFPQNRNFLDVCAMLYRRVVPAWRAYDMSALGDFPGGYDLMAFQSFGDYNHPALWRGDDQVKRAGIRPDRPALHYILFDYTRPETAIYQTIRDAFRPLKVFLGGETENFTSKDHAFFSGENFEKSIVIVNDKTTAQNLRFRWEFSVGGKTVSSGTPGTKIDAGGILKLPIRLTAPEVAERSDGVLKLEVYRDGFAESTDQLAIQIFPKHRPPEFRNVSAGLYDPVGKTAAMLRKAGFPFRAVSSLEEARKCRLLIIGQNALGSHLPEFLKQIEEQGVLRRGYKILMFEQKACNLGNFVFESPSSRTAFIRRPESLLVRGLRDEDFRNWRGESDTVPAQVVSDENSPHYPRSKWKCGNGGIVAGNVIRKPTYGNFSTIVDCGFNLMFAALMELKTGHGQVLFCQLDVTSRYGMDPAATRLVDNILTEMGKPNLPIPNQSVAYLGDRGNARLLQRMGMEFDILKGTSPWELNRKPYQVVILGKLSLSSKGKEEFRKFFAKRKSYVYIALPGAPLELLPVDLKIGKLSLFRASAPKNDPLFAGIPDADLYFREARSLPVIDNPPKWMVTTSPALFGRYDFSYGAVIVMNLSPDQVEEKFWLREKISRVWNTMFHNLNIGLGKDFRLFTLRKTRHNTITPPVGEIVPEKAGLKLDPQNRGSVRDSKGFLPVRLGLPWEDQGFSTFNPNHLYPANVKPALKVMYDGAAWYRIPVTIPKSWKNFAIRFKCSAIDDADVTFFNEVKIGETKLSNLSYQLPRSYRIPAELVKFGEENSIVIRVYDRWGKGGVTGSLSIVAEDPEAENAWSPYLENLNFYDVDAFHNW